MTEMTPQTLSRAGVRVRAKGASRWALAVMLLLAASGCGPAEEEPEPFSPSTRSQELDSMNGLSANGLSANGLSANGLSANGLSANGLSANGLSAENFASWFATNPALSDMVMRYIVRCAVPAGETRSYTDPQTGQSYSWSGNLGLAPDWAAGAPATTAEQQVITACLMAHVNRYGLSIPISVLGRDAHGELIPYSIQELATLSVREACFFGNLFTDEGLFFGVDRLISSDSAYLTRACAGMSSAQQCEPMQFVGACWLHCTPELLMPFYSRCTHNGVSYRAITTRMRVVDYEQLFQDAP
ncbi:hypothetical protein [Hyalangium versicolor]|uniref:hypothetical protein n=1 Tax=Hyalangium versicolor TaxID=2861190 RepID=UPI001CCBAC5C|nr:hypothetical protein [Hyalangium versicolor]